MHELPVDPDPGEVLLPPRGAGTVRPRRRPARDASDEIEHLHRLLVTLPVIEQAKGVLINHYVLDEGAAFGLLRRWSQASNTKITAIAGQVVAAASAGTLPALLLTPPYDPRPPHS